MGWRYLYIILGGMCLVMALVRALVLRSRESPRWLISCGRIDEAATVINQISATNGSDYSVTVEQFIPSTYHGKEVRSVRENVRRAANLFSGRQQVLLMVCLIGMWALIGIAYVDLHL